MGRKSGTGIPRKLPVMVVLSLALAATLAVAASHAQSSHSSRTTKGTVTNLGTLTPGVIKVAVEPYMPYSGQVNNQFVGVDIDILRKAAAALHQKLEFTLTDLAGTIASTTSHRVDMTLGSLTWTLSREKAGRFTDPEYYSPPAALVRKGSTLTSLASFSGKAIGVETGSNFAEAIATVPGAKPKYYSGVAQGLLDLQSGRIYAYLTDPLVAAYAAKQSATKGLQLAYYKAPTAVQLKAHPEWSNFAPYQVAMFLNKNEATLEKALDRQIDAAMRSGAIGKIIEKWGGSAKAFTTPIPLFSTQRQGVDRPKGWKAAAGPGG